MKIKGVSVTDSQFAVYGVLKQFGRKQGLPDHALVPLAQHALPTHLSSFGIRTRRHELEAKGLVAFTGEHIKTASGHNAAVFAVK